MTLEKQDLWDKLKAFEVGHPEGKSTFFDSIHSDTQWPQDFIEKVFLEYLKFVYLTQISDGPISPSIAVEKVWHAHLNFRTSYQDELCNTILNTELKAVKDNVKQGFSPQYMETIRLYKQEFNCLPDDLIWGLDEKAFNAFFQVLKSEIECNSCGRYGFKWARRYCQYCSHKQFSSEDLLELRKRKESQYQAIYKEMKIERAKNRSTSGLSNDHGGFYLPGSTDFTGD